MNPEKLQQAIELYDRFTHEGMDRRDFFARMTLITGSAAAATGLIASIAASPAAAAVVPANDGRLVTSKGKLSGKSGLSGYVAAPKTLRKAGVVMVVHENRGLNAHIEDVARRMALEGFYVVAPDFLSPVGGTPADENQARDMIGKLDLSAAVASAITLGEELKSHRHSNGQWGITGFCWGGAFVHRTAAAAGDRLDAGVSWYGPAPDPAEAAKVRAPLMVHLAGLDERVNRSAWPWITALREAGRKVSYFNYEGANHAFHNDTSAERYNAAAAKLAWGRTVRFFKQQLA